MERPSNTNLMLLAGTALFLAVIAYFTFAGGKDPDVLGDTSTFAQADDSLDQACTGRALYDQVKVLLFEQAAVMRGKDQDAFRQIAASASVRLENPAGEGKDEASGIVSCSGSLAIDLPPGVATAAGRNRVMSDIAYGVMPAERAGKVVDLRNADALVTALSSLTLNLAPSAPLPSEAPANVAAPVDPADPLAPVALPPTLPPAQPQPPLTARPSYDCAKARSQSERMVCADPRLAGLDRAMAAEYVRAVRSVAPAQQTLLRQTRDRFLVYRDNCPNSACIAGAYSDRIREIRDIAAGRWVPSR